MIIRSAPVLRMLADGIGSRECRGIGPTDLRVKDDLHRKILMPMDACTETAIASDLKMDRNISQLFLFLSAHLRNDRAFRLSPNSWIYPDMAHRFPFVLLAVFSLTVTNSVLAQQTQIDVWLGTSARQPSEGIYHCLLNTDTGRLSDPTLVAEVKGPGFLAQHPSQPVLYAVGSLDGKPSVVAYTIAETGRDAKLELLNSLEIGDGGAAHVAVDRTGKTLLTAQYGGGSVASFKLAKDGSLEKRISLIDHEGGSGIVKGRQESSHAHWCGFSPDNRFAFVPDLGLDQVVIYKVNVETAELTPHGSGQLSPGAGPRHMKFHPNGKWIYVLHELDLKVTLFDYDPEAGTMSPRQTIETVSRSALAKELFKSCSEIRIHPSGRFAYAANRGHDTITAYSIDQKSGELSLIEVENARAVTPRNFNVSPDGKWALVAGQDSSTLASFMVNQDTGELTYNRNVVRAPSCICVLFGHE